ncbi:hypothetical protein [Sphaerisporangium dianthi]|uniref:NACHT domain-containing protein n=1 Tax=Sphaerisporangium dianthi TaxID=1436120 RepID=A0ABV9CUK2_9ACTN
MREEMDPRSQFAERLRALKAAAAVSFRDLEIASARTPRRRGDRRPLRLKRSTIAGMTSRTRPVCPEQEHFEAFVDTCLRIAAESGRPLPGGLGEREAWDAAYRELLLRLAGVRGDNRLAAEAARRIQAMPERAAAEPPKDPMVERPPKDPEATRPPKGPAAGWPSEETVTGLRRANPEATMVAATTPSPWRRRAPVAVTQDVLASAMETLAGLVDQQWRTEATLRSLDDPDPIPVRWRLTGDDRLMDHPGNLTPASLLLDSSSGDIAALAGEFRAMRRRRLVVLGGPGTGKTTLAVQLLRELLATRHEHPGEPVPVLLSVAGWDTAAFPLLHDWLAERLAQDYPALRATALGPEAPATLAGRGKILSVLDGLDELPRPRGRRSSSRSTAP